MKQGGGEITSVGVARFRIGVRVSLSSEGNTWHRHRHILVHSFNTIVKK